ncbi:MAG: tRNA lysidine(34) synthetase TilS [Thermomicrobiales bacterium]
MSAAGSGAVAGFEQRLLARSRAIGLDASSCVLVAFSSGPDSLALAAALTHVRAVLGVRLVLAHIDHGLRQTSGADARRAAALGAGLGCETVTLAIAADVRELHPGAGLEDAARRERYRLLREAAETAGAELVATAHHQDDQAETVLLHLLRGSGLNGARGMAEFGDMPASPNDISQYDHDIRLRLWRPLLGESRREILSYLALRRLHPVLDPTNDETTFRRNWLRHDVLPVIEARVPGAGAALARYASLAADDDALLESLATRALTEALDAEGRLSGAQLTEQPAALQRRMVRGWLARQIGLHDLSAERVEAVRQLAARADNGRVVELSGGWRVRRARGMLCVTRSAMWENGEEGTA